MALPQSPAFLRTIPNHAVDLLSLAAELHHPILFRECMVHIVGDWHHPKIGQIKDPGLRELAQITHDRVSRLIAVANNEMLVFLSGNNLDHGHKIAQLCVSSRHTRLDKTTRRLVEEFLLPKFYRGYANPNHIDPPRKQVA